LEAKFPNNIYDISQKGYMKYFLDKEIFLFGVDIPKIVESLNVELHDIKIEERRSDLVFLLENDSLLHIEFQTGYKRSDLTRFLIYDALIHEQHKLRNVTTVIIYAAGIKRREFALDFETLTYHPYVIFLEEKDGDEILQHLEDKFLNNEPFNDEDILNLLFILFMKSDIIEPRERAVRVMEVVNAIEDPDVREMATATTVGIMGKFFSLEEMMNLSEVFEMIDPVMAVIDKLADERADERVKEEKVATAKRMLGKNTKIADIADATMLSVATIESLQLNM